MKYAFMFFLAALFCKVSFSQSQMSIHELEYTIEDNSIVYQKVITIEGIDSQTLFNKALQYFSFNYGSGSSVVQLSDKELGIIVGKGLTPNINKDTYRMGLISIETSIWHLLKIETKDERVRVSYYYNDYEFTLRGSGVTTIKSHILHEPPITMSPSHELVRIMSTKKATEITKDSFNKLALNALHSFMRIEEFLSKSKTDTEW